MKLSEILAKELTENPEENFEENQDVEMPEISPEEMEDVNSEEDFLSLPNQDIEEAIIEQALKTKMNNGYRYYEDHPDIIEDTYEPGSNSLKYLISKIV